MSKLVPSRRSFLQLSAATAAAASLAGCRATPARTPIRRARSVVGRVRHAQIGVGGMGASDLAAISSHPMVDVVALCDIDANNLGTAAEAHTGARTFSDWRRLFAELGDEFDTVCVSTPDHMHAPIAMTALQAGKHVYCQKPLTHTVVEARQLALAASASGAVTQMGIQNHSNAFYRQSFLALRSGVIGKVRAAHVWTDRPAGWWPQGVDRPEGADPVPAHVDWDLWLGVAPERPYKPGYHPFAWRGFRDFGTGAQGDMACHLMDPALWFLELGDPLSFRSDGPAPNSETFPTESKVSYRFPPTRHTTDKPFELTWYDGGTKPEELLAEYGASDAAANACLFVGEEGALLSSPYATLRLLPGGRFEDFVLPEVAALDHWHQWVDACIGLGQASAPFHYSSLLSEVALLGNVALPFPGETLDWDARRMRVLNVPEANKLVSKEYRPGWSVPGLG